MKMVLFRTIAALLFMTGIASCANPAAGEFKKNYLLDLGDQTFSLDVNAPPYLENIEFNSVIPYKDEGIFKQYPDVGVLRLTWLHKSWPLGLHGGGLAKIYIDITKTECNTEELDCLNKSITRLHNLFLVKKLNRPEVKIDFTEVEISGQKWLKYNPPIVGPVVSYSISISNNRYLSVHVDYLGSTSTGDWLYDANANIDKTIKSMRFIKK